MMLRRARHRRAVPPMEIQILDNSNEMTRPRSRQEYDRICAYSGDLVGSPWGRYESP
jgi:hypothetical protein